MVAIIGSGIAGLTAALQLANENIDFDVFESSDHIGGKIRSERINGFLVEHGPHWLQGDSPLVKHIIEQCSLGTNQLFATDEARTHYVVRNNIPVVFPSSPSKFLTSHYFSARSRLKLAAAPFFGKADTHDEESIAQFVRRRLGQEILDYAIDPYVRRTFTGDPELLSVKHALPELYNAERRYGSVARGLMSNQSTEFLSTQWPIFSFTDGMQMLPHAIAQHFLPRIQTGSRVRAIIPAGKRWRIDIARGNHEETRHFDAVISTLPLPDLAKINLELNFDLTPLSRILYPPVHQIAMGFNQTDIDHSLAGHGMVVPHREASKRILGTIFSSTVFPNHSPAGKTLLTTIVGGTRSSDLDKLPFEILEELVLSDLDELLGVYGDPVMVHHVQWQEAIPQYNLGYGVLLALLNNLEAIYPGLFFAGSYREGVSVEDAMHSGFTTSKKVLQLLS